MQRWPPKRPSSAWITPSRRTCVDGHVAVILTNRRGGSVRSTGTQAKVSGHSKRPMVFDCGNTARLQSVGIRKSRAGVARMMVIGSTGQPEWADIRKRRACGRCCSSGKTDNARGVDYTSNMERTWWNLTTSSPSHKGVMAKPPTYNSFMDIVMTSRPRQIKRSKVLVTRAT
jgi:hypothetical protein